MAENSKIEWCDHTFNPWLGCTKVSAACDHCYAEGWAKRSGLVQWGNAPRRRTSVATWAQPFKWNRAAEKSGTRPRVFCASLADWLDNQAPDSWRDDLAQVIEGTPNLDWLLLTKRPQNWSKHSPWHDDDVPANVWLGVTAENQEEFDRRWPRIAEIPASVHFVSYEPALGPVTFLNRPSHYLPEWIIAGGESGPGFRAPDPGWFRSLRNECAAHGVPFLFKQWGGRTPKAGGRLLDGTTHDGYPA
jgi:protein gp37